MQSNAVNQNPTAENDSETSEDDETYSSPLDKIWIESESFSYEGYSISKKCAGEEDSYADDNCELKISENKRQLAKFTSSRAYWLQYGLFNFLGKKDKQLIVFTYSGGAHCCEDYVIYDLKPAFRVIYDSEKYDSADEIGSDLIPVDVDRDGIFEFQRNIMAFDYFFASHADSVFPPVIFAYDKKAGAYDFANKKFPGFVLKELEENLAWLRKNRKSENESQKQMNERYIVRKTFLNLVYAGKEEEAWKYFDENYNFEDKEEFKTAVRESFSEEVVYKSIYKSDLQ